MERCRVDGLADVVPPQGVSAGREQDGAQNRADNTSIYRALPGTLGATKVSGHSVLRPSPRLGVSKLYKCDNCLEHLKHRNREVML